MKKLISLTLVIVILAALGVAFADPGNVIRASVTIRGDQGYIITPGYIVNDEEVYVPTTAALMVLQKDALPLPDELEPLGGEDGLEYVPFIGLATAKGYKVTRDFAKEAKIEALMAKISQMFRESKPLPKYVVINLSR